MLDNSKIKILKDELNFDIDNETKEKLNLWKKIFVEYNSHTNLMSKNDIEVLFEKHVFDSLSILKWSDFKNYKKILDVGCGGGFPSVILAICFPEIKIIANDSRIKKINFIKEIKEKLKLDNLEILYSRIEEAQCENVDLIVSRAVGKMIDVWKLSKSHLKKDGKFLIYKAKLLEEEIKDFKSKYKNAKFEVIKYNLPLKENFERNLIIFSPNKA
ncbi:MAG: 16S rRNA (guanine(527)-N(7))-methyltransferase RsmG [Candidatus Gastranaerophilales bacterium]|nr:16S rRNA (guanine(527)-N(7))-methyltransferase RsmG [Candidatus Gastranaerophilales bacterium]